MKSFEQQFFTNTLLRLPSACFERLDALLMSAASGETDFQEVLWHTLAAEPAQASLDNVLAQIEKLQVLRRLTLP